jgi:hypothetical protein
MILVAAGQQIFNVRVDDLREARVGDLVECGASSDSCAGLNVTQISEPALRMVGMRISHDRSLTRSAFSTQQMSTRSRD